jgi:hypothetical protein
VYFSTIIGKLEQQHDAERVLCKLIRAIPLKELFVFFLNDESFLLLVYVVVISAMSSFVFNGNAATSQWQS